MVIHYVLGCGVHPMKRIWQAPVILKARLNKKERTPIGFLYFVFDADKSVVEFDRRGKAAKATLALVGTVREVAGFPKE